MATTTGGFLRGAGELGFQLIDLFHGRNRDDAYAEMTRKLEDHLSNVGLALGASEVQIEQALRATADIFEQHALSTDELTRLHFDPARAAKSLITQAQRILLDLNDETVRAVCGKAIESIYEGLLEDPGQLQKLNRAFQRTVLDYLANIDKSIASMAEVPAGLDAIRGALKAMEAKTSGGAVRSAIQYGILPEQPTAFQPRHISISSVILSQKAALSLKSESEYPPSKLPALPGIVLHGLGGTGKSHLAAAYARESREAVDVLIWIGVIDRISVVKAYSSCAVDLGLVTQAKADRDPESAAGTFVSWASGETQRRWLVVLDDIREARDVIRLWPTGPSGITIATTQMADSAITKDRSPVEVSSFEPGEAMEYLLARIRPEQFKDSQTLTNIAFELGRLPLALAQAAAYLDQNRDISCDEYQIKLQNASSALSALLPPSAQADDYQLDHSNYSSVSATMKLSIEAADSREPVGMARFLMNLAAWLDPVGIPLQIFRSKPVVDWADKLLGGANTISSDQINSGIRVLERFSLVEVSPAEAPLSIIKIHRLVQRVVRDEIDTAGPHFVRFLAGCLGTVWPDHQYRRKLGPLLDRLRSNLLVLMGHPSELLFASGIHPVLFRAVRSLDNLPGEGVATCRRIIDTANPLIGRAHPDVLGIRNSLATLLQIIGDSAEALQLMEECVRDCSSALGPTHQATLGMQGNLAHFYDLNGRHDDGVLLLQKVLSLQDETLGFLHLDTIANRGDLVLLRSKTEGFDEEKTQILTEVLLSRERILGPFHPNTFSSRINLALAFKGRGRLNEAITKLAETLSDEKEHLGSGNLMTINTHHALAKALVDAERLDESLQHFDSACIGFEEILGVESSSYALATADRAKVRITLDTRKSSSTD